MKIILIQIVVVGLCIQSFSQTPIRGTVYESEMGDKLNDVTVQLDGTDICSTTDSLGQYKIMVPNEKAYLLFKKVGYDNLYVKAKRNYEINIVMAQLNNGGKDINVGYGTQRSSEITGAVTSIGNGSGTPRSFVSSTKRLPKK